LPINRGGRFGRAHTRKPTLGRLIVWIERQRMLQSPALLSSGFGHSCQQQPDLGKIGLLRDQGTQKRARGSRVAALARTHRAF
jgi:hypothetical protein